MPGRDKTGPMGEGRMTGRGRGFCAGEGDPRTGCGFGPGMRRGFGGRFGRGMGCRIEVENEGPKAEKEWLTEQKSRLELRLEEIDKRLKAL